MTELSRSSDSKRPVGGEVRGEEGREPALQPHPAWAGDRGGEDISGGMEWLPSRTPAQVS